MRSLFSIKQHGAIDLRTLACFRIFLGFLLLLDILMRLPDLTVFYTDAGAYPREVAMAENYIWKASLHYFSGLWQMQLLLFTAAFISALCLMAGYRTRLFMVLSWALQLSLQNRNQLILQNSDVLLACLMFWAMFLPLGAKWSVDAALQAKPRKLPIGITTPATIAILLQALYVYIIGALLKDHPIWHNGLAVDAAVHVQLYALSFAKLLGGYPAISYWLTYFVYYIELLSPLLLFSPLLFVPVRMIALALLTIMHLGFSLALGIGLFPYISILSLTLFLPSAFWNYIELIANPKHTLLTFLRGRWKACIAWLKPRVKPEAIEVKPSRFNITVVSVLGVLVFVLNLHTLKPEKIPFSERLSPLIWGLKIDQKWDMFAPYPMGGSGWMVMEGKTVDGRKVDAWKNTETPPDISVPEMISQWYPNYRWRKYYTSIYYTEGHETARAYFQDYLCRRWNDSHAVKLSSIRPVYYWLSSYHYSASDAPQRQVFATHICD